MQVTFLLGPAGSGKTWRCLAEIRAALKASPEGLPLLLLAPKQATFQLERQLLSDPDLPGYTRLQIVSFERLAEFVLSESGRPVRLLDEEGRVMVLRAVLARLERERQLRIFHSTARLPGFSRQLGLLMRELQQHQVSAKRMAEVAEKPGVSPALAAKLADLASIAQAYFEWLKTHQLEDTSCLLDLAVAILKEIDRAAPGPALSGIDRQEQVRPRLGGIWLDGFAEMTPQELDLLAALLPFSEQATLAFCLDREPTAELPWLSTWSLVAQSYRQCRARLADLPDCHIKVETLDRHAPNRRFQNSPVLAHLEASWAGEARRRFQEKGKAPVGIRLVVGANPEAEAVFAAREILTHVQSSDDRRYRDCAVLVRSLDGYADVLRRVFIRYQIPFFLDRREPVAHHPLAELTRSALRTVAYGWRTEDWFGALKTGLAPAREEEIDWLENVALERGWEGEAWRQPKPDAGQGGLPAQVEPLRRRLVEPFLDFESKLAAAQLQPNGAQLAKAIRGLWRNLNVEEKLGAWAERAAGAEEAPGSAVYPAVHASVFSQMQAWLGNLDRAFANERLPLREWLPIVEAGLGGLTVGVVPPALDQVLVGAVDRSRNPDLECVLVLGLNDGVFPAPPASNSLLAEVERDELEGHRIRLGTNRLLRLGHERYLGYIACTRSTRRLVLTCAAADADGHPLNPSVLLQQVKSLCPVDEVPPSATGPDWREAVRPCEAAPALLRNRAGPPECRNPALSSFETTESFAPIVEQWDRVTQAASQAGVLTHPERLYGADLATSVSALEDYSACPFKFFAAYGLRAQERRRFEPDEREQGTFQHEILKEFQWRIRAQGRRWRDLPMAEALVMVRNIGTDLMRAFRGGLFHASEAARFRGQWLIDQVADLMSVMLTWARQYEFEPWAAELAFGFEEAPLPAWRLAIDDRRGLVLRGRIDRLDLCHFPDGEEALAVIVDYKSRVRPLDATKLHHGLQLQLPAYLNVLRRVEKCDEWLRAQRLTPAGGFYVNLRGLGESSATRTEVLTAKAEARPSAYQHSGRFDAQWLRLFDNRDDARQGNQFKYKLNKDMAPDTRSDALPAPAFKRFLDGAEQHLLRIGQEIYAGRADAVPYRKKSETACDYCDFQALCRFDPWSGGYRVLHAPPKPDKQATPPRKAERRSSA